MTDRKIFITLERFKTLKQEVKALKTSERKCIADKLSEYRDSVDLSEDSSYNDLLVEQADLEKKIEDIEELLDSVSIIKESKSISHVRIGSHVTIRPVGSQRKLKLHIVGSLDVNPIEKTISNDSPLGMVLMGKKKDEIVEAELPTGFVKYKIIDIA